MARCTSVSGAAPTSLGNRVGLGIDAELQCRNRALFLDAGRKLRLDGWKFRLCSVYPPKADMCIDERSPGWLFPSEVFLPFFVTGNSLVQRSNSAGLVYSRSRSRAG